KTRQLAPLGRRHPNCRSITSPDTHPTRIQGCGLEIEYVLKCNEYTKNRFCGVYPSDKIPMFTSGLSCQIIVANSQRSNMPGKHWLLFLVPKDVHSDIYFVDSYGKNVDFYNSDIGRYAHLSDRKVRHTGITLQGYDTNVCGQYTIYFAVEWSKGRSVEDILTDFSEITQMNDALVERYVNTLPFCCPGSRKGQTCKTKRSYEN
ncbi:unnamed protein product, partial [Owenia fusiformis]